MLRKIHFSEVTNLPIAWAVKHKTLHFRLLWQLMHCKRYRATCVAFLVAFLGIVTWSCAYLLLCAMLNSYILVAAGGCAR